MVDHPHSLLCIAHAEDEDVEDEDDGGRDEIEEVGNVDVDGSTVLFWVKVSLVLKDVLEPRHLFNGF